MSRFASQGVTNALLAVVAILLLANVIHAGAARADDIAARDVNLAAINNAPIQTGDVPVRQDSTYPVQIKQGLTKMQMIQVQTHDTTYTAQTDAMVTGFASVFAVIPCTHGNGPNSNYIFNGAKTKFVCGFGS